jgi:GntR family transcriptional regulator, rspAB operon transcriptional repressor|tara:strand:- start:1033 stop:1749 length:717 start_codon:yes stop_codon:yes gene_type:complete
MPDIMKAAMPLPSLGQIARPSVADQVFDALHTRILSLELPPGTKISEADVASQMDTSRQPVRDAFWRLSKLGFLTIRPQRATTVSLISGADVMRAKFIRTALESETCRTACLVRTDDDLAALSTVIAQQKVAVDANDRQVFHRLDDQFHREICTRSGVAFVWDMIHESKAHMDRVRILSLDSNSQKLAYKEHIAIVDAITARDGDGAADCLREHLSRIRNLVGTLKERNHDWFTKGDV